MKQDLVSVYEKAEDELRNDYNKKAFEMQMELEEKQHLLDEFRAISDSVNAAILR